MSLPIDFSGATTEDLAQKVLDINQRLQQRRRLLRQNDCCSAGRAFMKK